MRRSTAHRASENAAAALVRLVVGGISIAVGPVRLASSGVFRPLAGAAILLAAVVWLAGAPITEAALA